MFLRNFLLCDTKIYYSLLKIREKNTHNLFESSRSNLFPYDIYVLGVITSITPFVHRRSVLYTGRSIRHFLFEYFLVKYVHGTWSFEQLVFSTTKKYALYNHFFLFLNFDCCLFVSTFLPFSFLLIFFEGNLKASFKHNVNKQINLLE